MSDATVLAAYQTARDAVATAIASGIQVVEYEINGRRVRREASWQVLKELELLIDKYRRLVSVSTGSSRNLARMKQKP